MNHFYKNIILGVVVSMTIFLIFIVCQNNFAMDNKMKSEVNSVSNINEQLQTNQENEKIKSIEIKVDYISKYVNDSQKNLDLWLKLLTFILSVLMGYSIFAGLKGRELAKEELNEIRRIRGEISKEAESAADRLKDVKKQIELIENTASNAKTIEKEMKEKLNELANKEDVILNESQIKVLDDTISKTKEDLQKTGIDALKNLYLAKIIKNYSEKNWEETLRLCFCYLDYDENNDDVLFKRGRAYYELYKVTKADKTFLSKAILDYNKVISINPNNNIAFNNRGTVYRFLEKYDYALKDYDESIRLKPNYSLTYSNRALVYGKLGKENEAQADIAYAKQLESKKQQL